MCIRDRFWSQSRTPRDTLVTNSALDHHCLDATTQTIPHQPNSSSIQSLSLQFRGKDVARLCVKGFTKVQTDDMHSSSVLNWCGFSIIFIPQSQHSSNLIMSNYILPIKSHSAILSGSFPAWRKACIKARVLCLWKTCFYFLAMCQPKLSVTVREYNLWEATFLQQTT